MNKIQKTDNIYETIQEYPETVEIFLQYDLHCVGCPVSGADSIENGAKAHGLEDKEIEEMVERMNEVVEHKE